MQRRKPAPTESDAAAADAAAADDDDDEPTGPPRKWHESVMVRVVLVLLAGFGVIHLFLWKWVYDIAMSQNHERLRATVS